MNRLIYSFFSYCFCKEQCEHEIEKVSKDNHFTCICFRYITKEDVAAASMDKVKNDGGHVRLITKGPRPGNPSTK